MHECLPACLPVCLCPRHYQQVVAGGLIPVQPLVAMQQQQGIVSSSIPLLAGSDADEGNVFVYSAFNK